MTNRRTLTLSLAAAALATSFTPTVGAQTTLTLSTWLPATHPVPQALVKWGKDVEEATKGRVRTQLLPKPVSAPPGTYNAVRDGLADVSYTVLGYTPGRFTLSEFAELPLTSETAEQASVALWRVAGRHPEIMGEYKEVKVLGLFTHGPGVIFNMKKDVARVDDMKGLKFRIGGGIVNEIAQALDVNATLKPAGDSYELLSNGVMDGTWLPFDGITTFKLDKLVRHATTFPGGLYNSAFIASMNRKAFDALSKEDQAAIDRLSGESLSRLLGRAFDARDREGRALAQVSGIATLAASPALVQDMSNRVRSIEAGWVEKARAKGLSKPEAVIAEFRAEARKP